MEKRLIKTERAEGGGEGVRRCCDDGLCLDFAQSCVSSSSCLQTRSSRTLGWLDLLKSTKFNGLNLLVRLVHK